MKILAYNYREFDEALYFDKFSKQYGVEIIPVLDTPNEENAYLAKGADGVSVITQPVTENIIKIWKEVGVKHISTRTIGYDHIDIEAAKKEIEHDTERTRSEAAVGRRGSPKDHDCGTYST